MGSMKNKHFGSRGGVKTTAKTNSNHNIAPMIAFDKAGMLIAGQEYLEAIVKSGKTARLNVAVGCDSIEDLLQKVG